MTAKCQRDIARNCSFSEVLSSRLQHAVDNVILPDDRNADQTPSMDVLGGSRNLMKSEVCKARWRGGGGKHSVTFCVHTMKQLLFCTQLVQESV